MKLTDEQIKNIMQKDISCKTILVAKEDVDPTIEKYTSDGWTFVKKTELNERFKITFQKVK